jgi:hypothetical protein
MADSDLKSPSDTPKDTNLNVKSEISSNKGIFESFSNFFSNTYHTFVVHKSERLASAIYVITGFMPQDEPVRARLRLSAIDLIGSASRASELLMSEADRFEARCIEIATLLQTAQYAGLVSEMNAQMIGEEYGSLAQFVRTHAERISEPKNVLRKGSISEPKSLASSIRHSNKSLITKGSIGKGSSRTYISKDSSSRKNLILAIFDNRPEISLKDAVSVIPGVSEKTVQRELLDLVAQGVLMKQGNRRWTTYRKA